MQFHVAIPGRTASELNTVFISGRRYTSTAFTSAVHLSGYLSVTKSVQMFLVTTSVAVKPPLNFCPFRFTDSRLHNLCFNWHISYVKLTWLNYKLLKLIALKNTTGILNIIFLERLGLRGNYIIFYSIWI